MEKVVNKNFEEGKYTSVATKISPEDKTKLLAIGEHLGMGQYELLQAALLLLLRYFGPSSALTSGHLSMLHAFTSTLQSLKCGHNPLSYKKQLKERITKGVFFVEIPGRDERPQLLSIHVDASGNLQESYNYDKILGELLEVMDPGLLRVLREEREASGHSCISQTLHHLISRNSRQAGEKIADEIKAMFADCNRAINGLAVTYGERTRRKKHFTPDTIPRQRTATNYKP